MTTEVLVRQPHSSALYPRITERCAIFKRPHMDLILTDVRHVNMQKKSQSDIHVSLLSVR